MTVRVRASFQNFCLLFRAVFILQKKNIECVIRFRSMYYCNVRYFNVASVNIFEGYIVRRVSPLNRHFQFQFSLATTIVYFVFKVYLLRTYHWMNGFLYKLTWYLYISCRRVGLS